MSPDDEILERFESAGNAGARLKVVEEYLSQFPDEAFKLGSWFYSQYHQWRVDIDYGEHRALLRAVGRGI